MLENENKNNISPKPQRKNVDGIIFLKKKEDRDALQQEDKENDLEKLILPNWEKPITKQSSFYGIITALLLIFLFSVMPIRILESQNNMTVEAKESISKLVSAYASIKEDDYEQAKTDLAGIGNNLVEINNELEDVGQKNNFISQFSILDDNTLNYERLFNISNLASKIGDKIFENIDLVKDLNLSNMNSDATPQIFDKFQKLNTDLNGIENEFKSLKINIENIDENKLNEKEKGYVLTLKNNFGTIEKSFYALQAFSQQAPEILGETTDKKYLVLFQNDTELRATGGFIGTYGILTIRNGKIKNIFIDSIYNADGQLSKKIDPPEPLKKIVDTLHMRDANWYPDFPTSAKQISNLYELEGGFTPDGIIAIDTKTFVDLLGLTGPIKLEKYDSEINQANFIEVTQYKTSIDYDPADKNPKKFLADFAPLFLAKLSQLDSQKQSEAFAIIEKNLAEKHLLFYSPQSEIENIYSYLNIAGEIKNNNNQDYLLYVSTNIGGLKTNHLISDSIDLKTSQDQNGNISHQLVLTRKHEGKNEGFSGTNFSYLRFYLPLGSKVLAIKNFEKKDSILKDPNSGILYLEDRPDKYLGKAGIADIDIYEENGKTVVGTWQVIKPGEEIESEITYQLPSNIRLGNSYNLLIQKQAGVLNQNYSLSLDQKYQIMPPDSKDLCKIENNIYQCSFDLTQDRSLSFSSR